MTTFFGRVAPRLWVADIARSLAFWDDCLGFSPAAPTDDTAGITVVHRDLAEVQLALNTEAAGTSHCHIRVQGLEGLASQLTSQNVCLIQPLQTHPDGTLHLVLTDPDGNTVEVAEIVL